MKFVKFEDRKAYGINEIGVLCDYEPIPIDEEKVEADWDTAHIGDSWYRDPHYFEDFEAFYENTPEDSRGVWWECPYYYNQNRVVILDTVDTNVYMFDLEHQCAVFRRPT